VGVEGAWRELAACGKESTGFKREHENYEKPRTCTVGFVSRVLFFTTIFA